MEITLGLLFVDVMIFYSLWDIILFILLDYGCYFDFVIQALKDILLV